MADDLITIEVRVKSNATQATEELNKLEGALGNASGATSQAALNAKKLADAQRLAGKTTNQFGMVAQQVGYQVGDFFVQVQSGTSALVAFGQQGTQLAGLLPGLAGAILGIGISLGTALVAAFLRYREEADKATVSIMRLSEAQKELNVSASSYSSKIDMLKFGVDTEQEVVALKESIRLKSELEKLNTEYRNTDSLSRRQAIAEEALLLKDQLSKNQALLNTLASKRAELDILNLISEARRQEAEAYADTVEEANKLKDSIGQAHLEALGLSQVPLEAGINAAAEAARLLSDRLGISLDKATGLIQLTAQQNLEAMKFEFSSGGQALQRYGSRGANVGAGMPMIGSDGIPMLPSTGNGGGGGGGVASPDALEALLKRVELEKELLGTSEAYKEVMQAIKGSDKEYSDAAIQGAVARLEAINKEKEALQQMQSLQQSVADTIGDGLMSIVDGTKTTKEAFRDMARDIIRQLYDVLVVQRLVGNAQNGTGIAGLIGGLFANGGAFSAGRQIQAYANGGVVGGPTYFPMAGGKTGLMGEAGPEAIMPLKRGRGGKLGVSVEGASGSVVVNNTINVTGGSDPAAIRAEVAKLMPQITSATKSAVIDARRRGGQMKAAFG